MEKIWLKQYQKNIAHEIEHEKLLPLNKLMEKAYKDFSHKAAFTSMGKTLSFQELEDMSARFAYFLNSKLKQNKGQRIAIMMPNILQYPVSLHGAIRAGLIVVNVNPLYTARELIHQLNDAQVDTIVILENFAHVLQEALPKLNVKNIIITKFGDLFDFPKKHIINFVLKYVKKMVPDFSIPQAISFNECLQQKDDNFILQGESTKLDDIAFLQYTGGTTGLSKGAILSHNNISANIMQAKTWLGESLKTSDNKQDVVITALPLYHIFSLTANCLTFMTLGGENILIPNARDIPAFIKTLKQTSFTVITGVNTLFNALLNHPEFNEVDFSPLKIALGGGMAVQRSVAEKWEKITKKPLIEAYGLTETSPAACINPLDLKAYNGTIGLPISSTNIKIISEEGEELGFNQAGELCISGPQVMQGYWNRPEETQNAFTEDKFFKTGDVAVIDDKGYITLVDRKKDMILVSGFNVYPNEVEAVASEHPDILECAAVGIESEKSGEVVKLFVVKKNASLTEKDVITHCASGLTGYKVPKSVEFREELPKTNVGKILRRALKD